MPEFPQNAVEEVKASVSLLESAPGVPLFDHVLTRPLKPTDPTLTAGVFASDWDPMDAVIGQHEPLVSRYNLSLQAFVKHGSEEEGIALHADVSKRVRVMLYRDADLRVRLSQLNTDDSGIIERVSRWGARTQRYMANEISGNFVFLSVLEFWIETEIV